MSGAVTGLGAIRKAVLGAAAMVTTAASLLVLAPAAGAATTCTLKPEGLEAIDLEDNSWYWWDDTDEISVNYNSIRYLFTSIKQNQFAYPPSHNFSGSMTVSMNEWDEDLSSGNKYLGAITVSESEGGLGQRSQAIGRSSTNGYEYRLYYRVECGAPATRTVPDVTGRTATEATNVLQGAGFVVYRYSTPDCGPSGYVVRQNPTGGTALATGGIVRIYVSSYSRYCL